MTNFDEKIYKFLESISSGQKKNPHLGKKEISLELLYSRVESLGGYDLVNEMHAWGQVVEVFQLPNSVKKAPESIQAIYVKYLLEYEKSQKMKQLPKKRELQLDAQIGIKKRKTIKDVDAIRLIECIIISDPDNVELVQYSLNLILSKPSYFFHHAKNTELFLHHVIECVVDIHLGNSFFNETKRNERIVEENGFLALSIFHLLSREKVQFDMNPLLSLFSKCFAKSISDEWNDKMCEILINMSKFIKISSSDKVHSILTTIQKHHCLETIEVANAFLENPENGAFMKDLIETNTIQYCFSLLEDSKNMNLFLQETSLYFLLALSKIDHFKHLLAERYYVLKLVDFKGLDIFHLQLISMILLNIHTCISRDVFQIVEKSILVQCTKSVPIVCSILSVLLDSMTK